MFQTLPPAKLADGRPFLETIPPPCKLILIQPYAVFQQRHDGQLNPPPGHSNKFFPLAK
jgi:hypothetical protein